MKRNIFNGRSMTVLGSGPFSMNSFIRYKKTTTNIKKLMTILDILTFSRTPASLKNFQIISLPITIKLANIRIILSKMLDKPLFLIIFIPSPPDKDLIPWLDHERELNSDRLAFLCRLNKFIVALYLIDPYRIRRRTFSYEQDLFPDR